MAEWRKTAIFGQTIGALLPELALSFTFSSQMCTILWFVFSYVTIKDFEIKIKQRTVIHFFAQKGKSSKETIFTLKTNYWRYKHTGKGGKTPPCKNQVNDWSVKSQKLMWIRSGQWSGKTSIWLFEMWNAWQTFPSWPFAISLHKISECNVYHHLGYHISSHVNNGDSCWNLWGMAWGASGATRFVWENDNLWQRLGALFWTSH